MTQSASQSCLLIVNPRSGGGKTGKIFDAMRAPLERALGRFDVVFTERGRHAVALARAAAREGRAVDDGTIRAYRRVPAPPLRTAPRGRPKAASRSAASARSGSTDATRAKSSRARGTSPARS